MGILDNLKQALGSRKHEPAASDGNETRTPDVPADMASVYTVQSGDTLWKIALECYGDGSRYLDLFEANRNLLKDPEHILPGQKLNIPR